MTKSGELDKDITSPVEFLETRANYSFIYIMSSRQRARVSQLSKGTSRQGSEESDDSEESQEDVGIRANNTRQCVFAFDESSESGSSGAEEDLEIGAVAPSKPPVEEEPIILTDKPCPISKVSATEAEPNKSTLASGISRSTSISSSIVTGTGPDETSRTSAHNNLTDDAFLDAIIKDNALTTDGGIPRGDHSESSVSVIVATLSPLLFGCDPKQLDMDQVLRQRFGGLGVMGAGAAVGGGGGGGMLPRNIVGRGRGERGGPGWRNTLQSNRKCLFGSPKDGWPKPPAYLHGGVGMVRCSEAETRTTLTAAITIPAASKSNVGELHTTAAMEVRAEEELDKQNVVDAAGNEKDAVLISNDVDADSNDALSQVQSERGGNGNNRRNKRGRQAKKTHQGRQQQQWYCYSA